MQLCYGSLSICLSVDIDVPWSYSCEFSENTRVFATSWQRSIHLFQWDLEIPDGIGLALITRGIVQFHCGSTVSFWWNGAQSISWKCVQIRKICFQYEIIYICLGSGLVIFLNTPSVFMIGSLCRKTTHYKSMDKKFLCQYKSCLATTFGLLSGSMLRILHNRGRWCFNKKMQIEIIL